MDTCDGGMGKDVAESTSICHLYPRTQGAEVSLHVTYVRMYDIQYLCTVRA